MSKVGLSLLVHIINPLLRPVPVAVVFQTASSSLFGIGSQPTKCVKTYTTPPVMFPPNTSPIKLVKLVWVDTRTVVLLAADGSESRYRV